MISRGKLVWVVVGMFLVLGVASFFAFRGNRATEKRFDEIRPSRGIISS